MNGVALCRATRMPCDVAGRLRFFNFQSDVAFGNVMMHSISVHPSRRKSPREPDLIGNHRKPEFVMRRYAGIVATSLLLATMTVPTVHAQSEAEMHPRIARAIHDLEDAIAYMQAAPNDFGGHKGAALNASRAAVSELRAALAFRARQDGRY